MRKIVAAGLAGLLIVASGQAIAANSNGATRIGDRVGARVGDSSKFVGAPVALIIIGGVITVAAIASFADNDDDAAESN